MVAASHDLVVRTQDATAIESLERPSSLGANAPAFGSDVAAETLRDLNISFIALNPGASFRGLHDSIVNYLGNKTPQMLLCLHEEAAVATAHGYAKVTGNPMAVAVHSNVGLMHASMAMFNAWCDRLPVIVLGATGPVDAAKRRPNLPISWNAEWWPFRGPLDYLGDDGGGGLGGGLGISVGSALALKSSGRLPIAICGDGGFLMGVTEIWTAAHYRIPILFVIANNSSYYNDEVHQERVARLRNRPVENKWIGQRISDPDPDIAGLARAQGARGIGPVLPMVYAKSIAAVEAGETAVIDVRIEPGYSPHVSAAMLSNTSDRGR